MVLNLFSKKYISLLESEPTEGDASPANTSLASLFAKPDSGTRSKTPMYPLNRRPAGGLSRPLPSPGNRGLSVFNLKFGVILIAGVYELWSVTLQQCPSDALFSCLKN